MNNEIFFHYAFVLLLASGFFFSLRAYLNAFLSMKRKELALLAAREHPWGNPQAYERMVIFLERIKPASLVKKFDKSLACHEFVFLIEKSVLEEFEYNLSQQLYISTEAWLSIIDAKENLLNILKKSYEGLADGASLQDLKAAFLVECIQQEDKISLAISKLKSEMERRSTARKLYLPLEKK